jgi:hypothetical protein
MGDSVCVSAKPAMRGAIWSALSPVPAGMTNSIGVVGSQATSEVGAVPKDEDEIDEQRVESPPGMSDASPPHVMGVAVAG